MVTDESIEINKKPPIFKNPNYQNLSRTVNITGKKKNWKSLKQILAHERSLPWPANATCCKLN